jgi:hypothetical protein
MVNNNNYYKFVLTKENNISSNNVDLNKKTKIFSLKIKGKLESNYFNALVSLYYNYIEDKITKIVIKKIKIGKTCSISLSDKTCDYFYNLSSTSTCSSSYKNSRKKIYYALKDFFKNNFIVDKMNKNIIINLINEDNKCNFTNFKILLKLINDSISSSCLSIKSKLSNSCLDSDIKSYHGKTSSITSSLKIFKICKTKLFRSIVKFCIFLSALSFIILIIKYFKIYKLLELDFFESSYFN